VICGTFILKLNSFSSVSASLTLVIDYQTARCHNPVDTSYIIITVKTSTSERLTVLSHWSDWATSWFSACQRFSSSQHPDGSGVHTASYPICTGNKDTGFWSWSLTSIQSEVKTCGAMPPISSVYSQHAAELLYILLSLISVIGQEINAVAVQL